VDSTPASDRRGAKPKVLACEEGFKPPETLLICVAQGVACRFSTAWRWPSIREWSDLNSWVVRKVPKSVMKSALRRVLGVD
jgi:hypothetical protein